MNLLTKTRNERFAIVSGAGPMAGALLYQLVIQKLQKKGAWNDADFPQIIIFNVPFSNMLAGETENSIVRNELIESLTFLSQHSEYIYIACQTLHAFLTQDEIKQFKVVSLLTLIQQALHQELRPIKVVGSKTSRRFDLHGKALARPCDYIETDKAEQAIDSILKGEQPNLLWLEQQASLHPVILGCTEFSVALQGSSMPFIDPIELAAQDMVDKFLH